MKSMTISQVSKDYGISTRTLRYYEQLGLIESFKQEGYAYRMYNSDSLNHLHQILLLRKLRIPLKQIKQIVLNQNAVETIKIFENSINEIDVEVSSLSTIKSILSDFVVQLQNATSLSLDHLLIKDEMLQEIVNIVSFPSLNQKEEKKMSDLTLANEQLSKLNDVRIIYLPASTVAAAHFVGDDPEMRSNWMIDEFVRKNKLDKIKPDLRHYGFNHPNPVDETGFHGYESWVTIPDELEVEAPLEKKYFEGGLYAAHMIAFGNFNEWDDLFKWVLSSDKYEFAGDMQDQEHMCGLLDEHLNYINHIYLENTEPEDTQMDLLMPIKLK